MTVKIPECTQQSPELYIKEFGAMNVLRDANQDNNGIEKKLQEDART